MYFACNIVKYETRLIITTLLCTQSCICETDAVEECLRAHMDTFPFPDARFTLLLHSPRPVVTSEESITNTNSHVCTFSLR